MLVIPYYILQWKYDIISQLKFKFQNNFQFFDKFSWVLLGARKKGQNS